MTLCYGNIPYTHLQPEHQNESHLPLEPEDAVCLRHCHHNFARHSDLVLQSIEAMRFDMEYLDSNSRAFVTTGDPAFLTYYNGNVLNLQKDKNSIRNLTVDNQVQQKEFPALDSLGLAIIQRSDYINSLRQKSGMTAALTALQSGIGQKMTEQFLAITRRMRDEETRLQLLRDASEKQRSSAQTLPSGRA
jgi:CHASE3 domain sensor protein